MPRGTVIVADMVPGRDAFQQAPRHDRPQIKFSESVPFKSIDIFGRKLLLLEQHVALAVSVPVHAEKNSFFHDFLIKLSSGIGSADVQLEKIDVQLNGKIDGVEHG